MTKSSLILLINWPCFNQNGNTFSNCLRERSACFPKASERNAFLKVLERLKNMKRTASCKHRPAVKTIQCEQNLFNFHLHSS